MIYIGLINNEIKLAGSDVEAVKDGAFACGLTLDSIEQTDKEVITAWDGKMYFKGEEPEKPLDDLKAAKRAEINKARDAAEQGGFEYMDRIFDSDQVSAQRISMAAQAMSLVQVEDGQPEPTITWTTQDNSTIQLNPAELLGLVAALAQWSNTCHQKATSLKIKIDEANSEEELNKITWYVEETNNLKSEEVIEDGVQGQEKEIEENKQQLQYTSSEEPAVESAKDNDNFIVELYSMEI